MDSIVWEEGPRAAGYAYHKVARYQAEGVRLKIDVSVTPDGSSCPVRITAHNSTSSDPQRLALSDPHLADEHLADIDGGLRRLGVPPVIAAYCAGDIVALIRRDGERISATQRELESTAVKRREGAG